MFLSDVIPIIFFLSSSLFLDNKNAKDKAVLEDALVRII